MKGFPLFVGLFLVFGCTQQRIVRYPDGRAFPERELVEASFPEKDFSMSGLRFDGVYVLKLAPPKFARVSYYYLRFWSNGRVLYGWSAGPVDVLRADDFARTSIGVYSVDESTVSVAMFVPSGARWGRWVFSNSIYTRDDDKLIRRSSESHGLVRKFSDSVYSFVELDGLIMEPDW